MTDYHTIIVGAGIVGSALAAFLSEDNNESILVVDRSLDQLLGSTGHAPGFVGQINESPILTRLAIDSVKAYTRIPDAFKRVGGLELIDSLAGTSLLEKRQRMAQTINLPATLLSAQEAGTLLPSFVRQDSFTHALHFPDDGVADPKLITRTYREIARSQGVAFLEADITSLTRNHNHNHSQISGIQTSKGVQITAKKVVVATGIWTSNILLRALDIQLPIIPVGHPYLFSEEREQIQEGPFIRWMEKHVYARDHGVRTGFGTYAHRPQCIHSPGPTALEPWAPEFFDEAVGDAVERHFTAGTRFGGIKDVEQDVTEPREGRFNGVFALTPDSHPLVGEIDGTRGLWVAAAVWVTHAAGAARVLSDVLRGRQVDKEVLDAMRPGRFGGSDVGELVEAALGTYNDIYGSERKNGVEV